MAIIYKCRHCKHVIGKLEQQIIETTQLGWDKLSAQDLEEMIDYQANGDIHMEIICENCQEALGSHPEYHELDYFIQ